MKLTLCVNMVFCFQLSLSKVHGQEYVHVNFPDNLCAGTIDTVSFGYDSDNDISLVLRHASLGQAGRAFLPDGVSCGSMGCSYRSTVTFTDFAPTAHISSIQDIKYVRLNIEHSWIGDIYIGITCPNGQKASLMNWSGTGSTPCWSSIPTNNRSWSTGSNVSSSTYFGMPVDGEGSDDCDSTQYGNRPGIGWNYCWSNNTTSGFSYASSSATDDGIIYRYGHATGGRIDSSNVAAGTNFYKPNESFSSLIGCPLNGNWYIEVIDGWGGDNGWIFGWEMALDPSLLPVDCELVERDIIGDGMVGLDDSTYVLTVPDDITSDSVMEFTLRMINNCGDTIDTLVAVNIHPNLTGERQDTVCDIYTWGSELIDHDTVLNTHLPTTWSCDSLLTVNLTVLHSTADTIRVAIVENSLPYSFLDATFTEAVSDTLLHTTNAVGCDSSVLFTLVVWENVATMVDSTVCAHSLPIEWNGITFFAAGSENVTLTAESGADSVVMMTLHVLSDDTVYVVDTVVENSLPYWLGGRDFDGPVTDEVTHLTNRNGCDSALHLTLMVWYNVFTDLDTTVCARWLPLVWGGAAFTDTHSVILHNIHGADSVVTMHVTISPNDTTDIFDTVVENSLPYLFQDRWNFVTDADTNLGLVNVDGCDSVLHYRLKVWRNVQVYLDTTVCDNVWPLDWHGYHFLGGGPAWVYTKTVHGADSNISLYVNVNPVYDTTVGAEICDNKSYTLGPQNITSAGHYEHTFASIDGCDSLVRVDLNVWPTYNTQVYDTVCASSGLTFDGVHYTEAGSYTKSMSSIHQCDSLITLNLALKGLYLKARAHISPSIVTPENLDIELEDISRASIDRLWMIGSEEFLDNKFTYTYPADEDTVPLVLIAYSDDGCADTLSKLLQIDRTTIFVPNTFTPGLETNSEWFVVSRDIEDMEVWIYNRQGNLVHHYTGADGSWDGTSNGVPCRQDVYVFRCEYRSRVYKDRQQTITGTILLLR